MLKLAATILMMLAAATQPTTRPIAQGSDGVILLHAKDVVIHGKTVRYEPQPNKNTIGFWKVKEDWVSWDFVVERGGKFEVIALQGCGKGSGGAEVEFSVGKQTLKMVVEDTGHFQNFVPRNIGAVELGKGTHTLAVKPLTKPGVAVMDLRQVTLKPVEEK
jgi:arylsulfatase A